MWSNEKCMILVASSRAFVTPMIPTDFVKLRPKWPKFWTKASAAFEHTRIGCHQSSITQLNQPSAYLHANWHIYHFTPVSWVRTNAFACICIMWFRCKDIRFTKDISMSVYQMIFLWNVIVIWSKILTWRQGILYLVLFTISLTYPYQKVGILAMSTSKSCKSRISHLHVHKFIIL